MCVCCFRIFPFCVHTVVVCCVANDAHTGAESILHALLLLSHNRLLYDNVIVCLTANELFMRHVSSIKKRRHSHRLHRSVGVCFVQFSMDRKFECSLCSLYLFSIFFFGIFALWFLRWLQKNAVARGAWCDCCFFVTTNISCLMFPNNNDEKETENMILIFKFAAPSDWHHCCHIRRISIQSATRSAAHSGSRQNSLKPK